MFLPAIGFLGDMLSPSKLTPSASHVPPLVADAIWARALGGRATELRPLNPFTIARMASCHMLAERHDTHEQRDAEHDECMKLIPGIQAAGYLSSVSMRDDGVWQTPRVPFIQIAQVTRMTNSWSREQLIDTIAERGEFQYGIRGFENAARSYFGKPAAELNVAQAALLAGMLGDRRSDPWCDETGAASVRRRVLARMRDNGVIDDAAFDAASRAGLGLVDSPPEGHKPCKA